MKINSVDNKTNFGWRYSTHGKITGLVIDEIPKLAEFKKTLTNAVIMPDFDEIGFKSNKHFYYPPQLFRPRESFMDFSGNNNAAAVYEKHMFQFDRLVNRDNEKAMDHAGRALHFLQDMTQPQHVKRGTIFQKLKEIGVHKKFEEYAYNYDDYFIKEAKPVELDVTPNDYDDLFDEAVCISEHAKPATKENEDMWVYLAQDGISNALAVTRKFLSNIAQELK